MSPDLGLTINWGRLRQNLRTEEPSAPAPFHKTLRGAGHGTYRIASRERHKGASRRGAQTEISSGRRSPEAIGNTRRNPDGALRQSQYRQSPASRSAQYCVTRIAEHPPVWDWSGSKREPGIGEDGIVARGVMECARGRNHRNCSSSHRDADTQRTAGPISNSIWDREAAPHSRMGYRRRARATRALRMRDRLECVGPVLELELTLVAGQHDVGALVQQGPHPPVSAF